MYKPFGHQSSASKKQQIGVFLFTSRKSCAFLGYPNFLDTHRTMTCQFGVVDTCTQTNKQTNKSKIIITSGQSLVTAFAELRTIHPFIQFMLSSYISPISGFPAPPRTQKISQGSGKSTSIKLKQGIHVFFSGIVIPK